jgi:hypothetical protein
LIRKLAEVTDGRVLHLTDGSEALAELFQVGGGGPRPPQSLWYALILAALLLYFLDIVARKLPTGTRWLARLGWLSPQRWHGGNREDGGPDSPGDFRNRAAPAATAQEIPPGELYVARLRGRSTQGQAGRAARR